jgi:signal transduction histidine kinase
LAIVRLIVAAHGGELQAAAPPFGGLTVRVELPRQQRRSTRPEVTATAGSTSGSAT